MFGLELVSGTNLTYDLTSVKIGAGKGLRAGGHARADPKTDVSEGYFLKVVHDQILIINNCLVLTTH